jgi:hypothetical protein
LAPEVLPVASLRLPLPAPRRLERRRWLLLAGSVLLSGTVGFGAVVTLAAPAPPNTAARGAERAAERIAGTGGGRGSPGLDAGGMAAAGDASASPAVSNAPIPSPTMELPVASLPPTPQSEAAPPVAVRTGMTAHYMWEPLPDAIADLDLLHAAGMRYTRFDFSWANSEPAKGARQYFDKLDAVLDAVIARGLTYTITVLETPAWANGGRGKMAPPADPRDYADFMGVLARHEAGRPNMVWEIWNEPNLPQFWTSGPDAGAYTAMLRAAYRAIKAADPDATVLVGGLAFNDVAYFERIYDAGGGNSFDGLAIHPYTIARSPWDTSSAKYSFRSSVPQFTEALERHGQETKPIYVTEMGWSTRDVPDGVRGTYLKDATAIARTWTNVPGMAVYTIRQSQFASFGLMTTGYRPTRSWNAYAAVQQ